MCLRPIDPTEIPSLFRSREFARIIDGIHAFLGSRPDDSTTHPNWHGWLATCYYFTSEFRQSIAHYENVLRMDPDAIFANTTLAHIFSCCPDPTFHNASLAVKLARRACHVSRWRNWLPVQVLITSYLRVGDFPSASRYADRSLAMADESQRPRVHVLLQCVALKQAYTTPIAEDLAKLDIS